MKIAVISDIHDNVWNLQAALAALEDADVLVCLGDLCSPFIVPMLTQGFAGRPVHVVFGNNDGDLFRITRNAAATGNVSLHGEIFRAELGGRFVVAVHYDSVAARLSREGVDLLCYGHNHRYSLQTEGDCLVLNPGPLMGFDPGTGQDVPASFVVYDTESAAAESFVVLAATADDVSDSAMGLVVKPYTPELL